MEGRVRWACFSCAEGGWRVGLKSLHAALDPGNVVAR